VPKTKPRDAIVDAFLSLAAEERWENVSLAAIAKRAGISLAELRAQFDGRLAILAEYIRRIDEAVLKDIDAELKDEPPRERLFDVLMARFEAHKAHKVALRNIARGALADPLFALALNRLVMQSMAWMLAGAGIPAMGRRGMLRAQGLALVWARVMRTYLKDDDAELARTMAALDKRLREAERVVMRLDGLDRFVDRCRSRGRAATPAVDGDMSEGHPT
jgi:AcrR family transcriptional regulator